MEICAFYALTHAKRFKNNYRLSLKYKIITNLVYHLNYSHLILSTYLINHSNKIHYLLINYNYFKKNRLYEFFYTQ